MEIVPLQQWGLFVRGVLLALIGVAFWVGGLVVFELLRRRIMKDDEEE